MLIVIMHITFHNPFNPSICFSLIAPHADIAALRQISWMEEGEGGGKERLSISSTKCVTGAVPNKPVCMIHN